MALFFKRKENKLDRDRRTLASAWPVQSSDGIQSQTMSKREKKIIFWLKFNIFSPLCLVSHTIFVFFYNNLKYKHFVAQENK